MSTVTTFYARHNGKTVGPVSLDELNDLTGRGIIPMKAEIWEAPISPATPRERQIPRPTRTWATMEHIAEQINIGFFRAIGAAPILGVVFGLVLVILYCILERVWAERIADLIQAARSK